MKKLLTILSSLIVVSASSSLTISCGSRPDSPKTNAAKNDDELLDGLKDYDLGSIDNLKPLKADIDDNEFNWDISKTRKKIIDKKWNDFGIADNQIGYYEIANKYFSRIDKLKHLNTEANNFQWNNDTYEAWLGFNFSLKNVGEDRYILSISSYSKKVNVNFESKQNIEQTLDSVIDGSDVLEVSDGSKNEILNKLSERLSKTNNKIDWNKSLDINNRLFERTVDQKGYEHTISIDNKTGEGTINIFFKNGDGITNFGSEVTQKIKIDNYNPLSFDYAGNPYYYFDDRTKTQAANIKDFDSNTTKFDDNKHVIVLGLDGVREDKLKSDILENNGDNYFQSFYSQPWESVYGWKSLLTGSISGDSTNIFKMVKDRGLSTYANTMWGSFKTRVFTTNKKDSGQQNIDASFDDKGSLVYKDLSDDGDDWIFKDYAKKAAKNFRDKALGDHGFDNVINLYGKSDKMKPSNIEDTLPKEQLTTNDEDLLNLNSLKSYASYENFLDTIKEGQKDTLPNLSFQYDTLEDNEGHSFNAPSGSYDEFYNSELYKQTMKAYKYEVNDLFTKYGNDDNTLVIVTTDHGRDENDSSHQGFDLQPKNSWFYSNKDLSKYEDNRYEVNQYSLKEIIYNFLKK